MIVIFFLIFFNFLLLLNLTYISQYFNIFDFPDGKLKLHKKKIPTIGGLILIINFTIIFFYQVVFVKEFLSFDIKKFENLLKAVVSLDGSAEIKVYAKYLGVPLFEGPDALYWCLRHRVSSA